MIKDRDMLGGVFEHTAVLTLIAQRCSKLLTFFTPAFFTSPKNQFICDVAQWNQLENEKKSLETKNSDLTKSLAALDAENQELQTLVGQLKLGFGNLAFYLLAFLGIFLIHLRD